MQFQQLLHQRDALLRQVRLANVAFAYERLSQFAARIARARLAGPVVLLEAEPETERFLPELNACGFGVQAVLEEHFLDEDIADLADILKFLDEDHTGTEWNFYLEELGPRYLPDLKRELLAAGIRVADTTAAVEETSGDQRA